MNGTVRALLGAAVGAILTLLLHPVSRPFLAVVFWHPSAINSNAPLDGSLPSGGSLDPPKDLLDASVWMQVAAERLDRNVMLSQNELTSSVAVAESAASAEPDNAFWKQMAASLLEMLGRTNESEEYWSRAAQCTTWNDLQTKRLQQMEADLAERNGSAQSWQYGKVYFARSLAPAVTIKEAAHKRIESAALTTARGREVRFQMILNGNLIRRGAQSLAAGQIGANIVEAAGLPKDLSYTATPSKRLIARGRYLDTLRATGRAEWARRATVIYRDNSSFLEFINKNNAAGNVVGLTVLAVVIATLPSVLLALSILGLLVWAFGVLVGRFPKLQAALCYPTVFSIGVILALATYGLTSFPLAGLAMGLCASFLAFTPKHERTRHPEVLGPFFKFTSAFLSLTFMLLMGLFFMVRTPPSVQVLSTLDVPAEVGLNTPVLVGLALLVSGLLLLIAPFWAFAQRVRTTLVLSLGLRSFGAMIAGTCLTGSIILCPLAVYADRALGTTLSEIVANEQVHYYLER